MVLESFWRESDFDREQKTEATRLESPRMGSRLKLLPSYSPWSLEQLVLPVRFSGVPLGPLDEPPMLNCEPLLFCLLVFLAIWLISEELLLELLWSLPLFLLPALAFPATARTPKTTTNAIETELFIAHQTFPI